MGFFETWVSASSSQFALMGAIFAVASLVEVVFVNAPNCKKTLNLRVGIAILALLAFAVLGLGFCVKSVPGQNTVLAFITMILATAYVCYSFAIALKKIIKAECETKYAGGYQVFLVTGAIAAISYMVFVALRQSDLLIYAEDLANGVYSHITHVPNVASNNIFLGILLIGAIIATIGTLFVFFIKLFKEDKFKGFLVLSLFIIFFVMAVPVYKAVIYNPGKAIIEDANGNYIFPDIVSVSMFSIMFGTAEGVSLNPVLISVPVIILIAILANYVCTATGKGKAVINYVTLALVTIASIIVIVSLSLKTTVAVSSGAYMTGFVSSPVVELSMGDAIHEKVAIVLQYADKYYYHASDAMKLYLVAPFFGIDTFAVVLSVCAIIVCLTYVIIAVIKKCMVARAEYLAVNPKPIVRRERIDEETHPFFNFLSKYGYLFGLGIAVIGFVLLFVVFNGNIVVGEGVNAKFDFIKVMLGWATTGAYGVILRPNHIALVAVILAAIGVILGVLGQFIKTKKPFLPVLSVLSLIAAGILMILVATGLNGYTQELYVLTASKSILWISGILFILAGLLNAHKYSYKGLKFITWFLFNNIGVVVIILCIIGLALYWTGRIT